ncbi:MAG: helix-turn-helix domain-containing protein [Culturomica sp.]|nr:helix-turn-helix domain-containing protein [Culturomica sp.]
MAQSAIFFNDMRKTLTVVLETGMEIKDLLCAKHAQRSEIEYTLLTDWVDGQYIMQALHLSLRTLQNLRTKSILPFSRIGNKFYYRLQDIRKLLADNYIMYNLSNRKK